MPNASGWTHDEDVHLCNAYTNISEDGATSTDQSSLSFWNRVHTAFLQLAGPPSSARKPGALQSRWSGLIRPDVALFASILAGVEAEKRSGWTDANNYDAACERFTARREQQNQNAQREHEDNCRAGRSISKRKPRLKPEAFRLKHCFDVLRQSVRFMRDVPRPRKRPSSSLGSETLDQHEDGEAEPVNTDGVLVNENANTAVEADDISDEGHADDFRLPTSVSVPAHPNSVGKKKAKPIQLEGEIDKAMMHSQRELAKATTAQVTIMQQQLEVARKKVEIMAGQQKAMADKAEMAVMCASTEGLSDIFRK